LHEIELCENSDQLL